MKERRTEIYEDPVEEVLFWLTFGYRPEGVIYCDNYESAIKAFSKSNGLLCYE